MRKRVDCAVVCNLPNFPPLVLLREGGHVEAWEVCYSPTQFSIVSPLDSHFRAIREIVVDKVAYLFGHSNFVLHCWSYHSGTWVCWYRVPVRDGDEYIIRLKVVTNPMKQIRALSSTQGSK